MILELISALVLCGVWLLNADWAIANGVALVLAVYAFRRTMVLVRVTAVNAVYAYEKLRQERLIR